MPLAEVLLLPPVVVLELHFRYELAFDPVGHFFVDPAAVPFWLLGRVSSDVLLRTCPYAHMKE